MIIYRFMAGELALLIYGALDAVEGMVGDGGFDQAQGMGLGLLEFLCKHRIALSKVGE